MRRVLKGVLIAAACIGVLLGPIVAIAYDDARHRSAYLAECAGLGFSPSQCEFMARSDQAARNAGRK